MKQEINIFDASTKNYLMRNNGFSVGFNMPEALTGEVAHGLPPYVKIMPYLVDKYPACPKDWLRSEGIVKSFFVPVKEDRGMWLDLNENENHTHHIAVVISIQGVNPLTGMPCKDAQLEQYIEECPKHNIKFGPDRYCSKCDFKWPKQNYICTTGTQRGHFWLDGFRTAEGIVRQYILTAEKMRGVASNIIGKDKVYAIGLSFFVSKEKKPRTKDYSMLRTSSYTASNYNTSTLNCTNHSTWLNKLGSNTVGTKSSKSKGSGSSVAMSWGQDSDPVEGLSAPGGSLCSYSSVVPEVGSNFAAACSNDFYDADQYRLLGDMDVPKGSYKNYEANTRSIKAEKLEVGAGAKINQDVGNDPEKLDFWHDKPESIICINYTTESDALKIIKQGEINLEGHSEGFLKNVPSGN